MTFLTRLPKIHRLFLRAKFSLLDFSANYKIIKVSIQNVAGNRKYLHFGGDNNLKFLLEFISNFDLRIRGDKLFFTKSLILAQDER